MVENCGHFTHLDEPEIVNQCIERFVKSIQNDSDRRGSPRGLNK